MKTCLRLTLFLCLLTAGTAHAQVGYTLSNGVLTYTGKGAMADFGPSMPGWINSASSVHSVVVGDSITRIGNNAFYLCSNVTSITIGSSVTSIGNSAFADKPLLTSITIPSSVTDIGSSVFLGCTGLTFITFEGDSTITIGGSAFAGCSAVSSITCLSSTPPTLGGDGFQSLPNIAIACLYVPQGAAAVYRAAIGWSAFGCVEEGSYWVTFNVRGGTPIGQQTIPAGGNATQPHNPTQYGYTFGGWHTNEPCTSPYNFSTAVNGNITLYAKWNECSNFTAYGVTGSLTWSLCSSGTLTISGDGAMPNYSYYYGSFLSTNIPWYSYRTSVTSVVLDSRITSIGDYAFYGCTNVGFTSITIPNSVTNIGNYAFQNCTGLTTLTVLNPIPPTMNINVFSNVNLAAATLYVPCGALAGYQSTAWNNFGAQHELMNNQNSVIFNSRGGTPVATQTVAAGDTATEPPAPTHVGYTFGGWYTEESCTNQWNFSTVLSSCNTTLYAKWNECGSLTYGVAGTMGWSLCSGTLTISGEGAMSYSTIPWNIHRDSITAVALDSRITTIGSSAFSGCTGLTSVTIPSSVTSISSSAFQNCTSLTSITIPSSVTSIGHSAFYGCSGLTSVIIPNSVTSIGDNAFRDCNNVSFTSITIPNSVTSIGSAAFYNCTSLASITSLRLTPPTTQSNTFTNVQVGCCLYVPSTAIGAYQTATGWSSIACQQVLPGTHYTVTFDVQGGSSVTAQSVEHGSTVQQLAAPTRMGYTFAGWYQEAECITPWNFATTITNNLTLYAKWVLMFTVSFNAQGGSNAPAAQQVEGGQLAQQPATNPTYIGYIFGGWYGEANCITSWNFATDVVPYSIILYAKWIPLLTVIFDAQGGTPPLTTQTVQQGLTAQVPTAPTRASYNFAGWFKEVLCTTAWSFASDVVTANTTLYAKWISSLATIDTVTFNSNGGSVVVAQQVERGYTAAEPGNPTLAGFTFGGWFTDQACTVGNEWSFSTAVSGNITLYALWECTVLFNSNGGSGVPKQVVRAGSKLIEPTPPTRHGRPFLGWYNHLCLEPQFKWNFSTDTVQGDMMLYGSWTQNP